MKFAMAARSLAIVVLAIACWATGSRAEGQENSSLAPPQRAIIGTWTLTSYARIDLSTKAATRDYGEHPSGYVKYAANGTMVLVVTRASASQGDAGTLEEQSGESSSTPSEIPQKFFSMDEFSVPPDSKSVPAVRTYLATYRVDGNHLIYHIDSAWTPTWIGTTQVRYFAIEGNKLTLTSEPRKSINGDAEIISVATFERASR
jgi:hypothetical protein